MFFLIHTCAYLLSPKICFLSLLISFYHCHLLSSLFYITPIFQPQNPQTYIYPLCLDDTNTNENAELKIVAEKTVWLLFVQFIFDSDTFQMAWNTHSKIKYSLSFHVVLSRFHLSPFAFSYLVFRSFSQLGYFVN